MSQPTVLRLRGDVDASLVQVLRPQWYRLAELRAPDVIVLDLTEVSFMDAAGLGLLIGLRNRQVRHEGVVQVVGCPPVVTRLLQLTHLDDAFPAAAVPHEADAAVLEDGAG